MLICVFLLTDRKQRQKTAIRSRTVWILSGDVRRNYRGGNYPGRECSKSHAGLQLLGADHNLCHTG